MSKVNIRDGLHELIESPVDCPLWNHDLDPTTIDRRKWHKWNIMALWVGLAVCIPTYMLGSSLISSGMNWWQAMLTILLGNVIVLFPMVLIGHAGTKYGIRTVSQVLHLSGWEDHVHVRGLFTCL